jgi:hypothetical protein
MGKRRTYAEIQAVDDLRYETSRKAGEIEREVFGEDGQEGVFMHARNTGNIKSEYQRENADVMELTFSSRDGATMRRVAEAIRDALKEG